MNLPTRKCGECHACCEFLSITDKKSNFYKEPMILCQHIKDGKCSIYDTKPGVCTGFYCMWAVDHHKGMFREEDRPDLSGVLVVMNDIESRWTKFTKLPSFTAYETKPDSFKTYWGDKLLKRVFRKWVTILMPWSARETKYHVTEGTEFRGPAKDIHLVAKFNSLEEYTDGKVS
jgi:hypothetical protein